MEKLIIVKTDDQLKELIQYIEENEYIAVDTETTGVTKESKVIGFSVSADSKTGYYVILLQWDVQNQQLLETPLKSKAYEVFKLLSIKSLIMHNAVFDCFMINNNFGIDLMPSVHTDTLILGHLLDENRSNGLKELALTIFGDSAVKEQQAMKESIVNNGGSCTKINYELYKADADLIARYGAKDTILTINLFYLFLEQLYDQNLEDFFYHKESMPLLRGPTYDLNTTGLKVDVDKLRILKGTLETECLEIKSFIYKEIDSYIKDKYPGTKKTNTFNITASKQIAWLLFTKLGNEFVNLTDEGKELCTSLNLRIPYAPRDKRAFIEECINNKGQIYKSEKFNPITKKMQRAKKVGDVWNYFKSDSAVLEKYAHKYKWLQKLLEYNKKQKLLNTYVDGLLERIQYGVIRPSFVQHGTTSGRYSSKNPNFQNLPREDKRIKSCIVSRPGKVFVGADYAQLEPRVFASMSKDDRLMSSFSRGEDFYSVVGAPIFDKQGYSLIKSDSNSFASNFPKLRDKSKVIALATPYGRTASFMAEQLKVSRQEAQELIDKYFQEYSKVELMMLESHEQAKANGVVFNLFGRPRRIPEAKRIRSIYGNLSHGELPYEARTLLNLSMNHRIQSTAASIMNRAAVSFWTKCQELVVSNPKWKEVKIVMQVHDELIVEGPEELSNELVYILKDSMENTVELPGVALVAEPKVAKNLADLK